MRGFATNVRKMGVIVGAAMLSMVIAIPAAQACGGFFCNNTEPTMQTGERILFGVDDDNIRAYVQVYFDGPADDFAWIVPVATVPDVSVGTDEVFTVLDQMTNPRFELDYQVDDACYAPVFEEWDAAPAGEGGEGGEEELSAGEADFVNVLAEGKAGPYNFEVVESNNSELLVAWLNENDYDQPPEALPLIEHYVAKEMKFVAVKLQPGKETGDIAPIVLDFQEQSPCIPLVLTSVAADENMPVKSYVLGKQRAVPTNWLHVTINQKKLDWFSMVNNWWGGGFGNLDSSYEQTLIEAIAEAEGHAFTTEYAGTSTIMADRLDRGQYDNVEQLKEYEDPAEFVGAIQNFFSGSNQLMTILQRHIPVPEGYNAQDFYNWPWDYSEEYNAMDIDLEALYDELIDVIVKPVQEGQKMFDDYPYLTRLYSRVPLEAMDRDPVFDFQDGGGDVSNVHTATLYITCNDEGDTFYIELENGEQFAPDNLPWEFDVDVEGNLFEADAAGEGGGEEIVDLPAAERIELFSPGMEPRVVAQEDVPFVEEQLRTRPSDQVEVPDADSGSNSMQRGGSEQRSGGCSTGSNGQNPLVWMGILMIGLLSLRRGVRRS